MLQFRARPIVLSAVLAALAALAALPASAQDFYAGKSIELLIGAPPGGGYDIYGRVVARHIGRHIPASPNIVPKNMPGAGSARAAGFIANIAPKDGTVIANIMPGAVIGSDARPQNRRSCSIRPRSCTSATSTTASASVCPASTRRSGRSTTRAS